jgi:hypothetical protein
MLHERSPLIWLTGDEDADDLHNGEPKIPMDWGNGIKTWKIIKGYAQPRLQVGLRGLAPEIKMNTISINFIGSTIYQWVQAAWAIGSSLGNRVGNQITIVGIQASIQLGYVNQSFSIDTQIWTTVAVGIDKQANGSGTTDGTMLNYSTSGTPAICAPTQAAIERYAFPWWKTCGMFYYGFLREFNVTIPCCFKATFNPTSNIPATNAPFFLFTASHTSASVYCKGLFNIYYLDA